MSRKSPVPAPVLTESVSSPPHQGVLYSLRFFLTITLAAYFIFQIFYVTATPLQEITLPDNLPQARANKPLLVGIGPDEKEHFLYIMSIAERGKLPAPLPRFRKSPDEYVSYQAQHPPLFYSLGAIVYKVMGGTDTPAIWYALRSLCALCGVFTIVFATFAVQDAFPKSWRTLAAAPFVGFLPMFGFMNGTLSNEPLALALGTFVWWRTVRMLRDDIPLVTLEVLTVGFCLALALVTRLTAIIWLLPFLYALWKRGGLKTVFVGAALPLCAISMLFLVSYANFGTPFLRTFYRPAIGQYIIDINFFRMTLLYYNATAWYPHWLTQFYMPGGVDGKIMVLPLLINIAVILLILRAIPKAETAERRVMSMACTVVSLCLAGTLQQQLFADWNVVISAGRYLVASLPAVALLMAFLACGRGNTARSAAVLFALMFGLNTLMVGLVRQFYKDHPAQPAIQRIEENRPTV